MNPKYGLAQNPATATKSITQKIITPLNKSDLPIAPRQQPTSQAVRLQPTPVINNATSHLVPMSRSSLQVDLISKFSTHIDTSNLRFCQ